MTDATIDLSRYGDMQSGRMDPRVRTGILAILGVAAGGAAIPVLAATGSLNLHLLAVRLLADAVLLLALVAYISLSTRTAVAQLRQQIVADIVVQVSAVVANRVVNAIEVGRPDGVCLADLAAGQAALTKELARLRGQTNIGLRDLSEAMTRVEACVKADLGVAYDLGAQSARD
jgi:hypothetical protein